VVGHEQTDDVFAMVPADLTELTENRPLQRPFGSVIALVNGFEVIPF
jgi:hypothetical protein